MARIAALALVCLAAACSRAPGGPSSAVVSPDEPFPKARASYAADYKIYDDDGAAREMTMFASGQRYRMESPPAPGQTDRRAAILEPAAKRVLSFRVGADQPKMALALQLDTLGRASDFFRQEGEPQDARPVARDRVAEIACTVWEIPSRGEGRPASRACISEDGILLRDGDVGAAHPNIEAVRVQRAPQDERLFVIPEGYEVVDFSPCLALQRELAAAKAGKPPDPARVHACEALDAKVEAVMGRP